MKRLNLLLAALAAIATAQGCGAGSGGDAAPDTADLGTDVPESSPPEADAPLPADVGAEEVVPEVEQDMQAEPQPEVPSADVVEAEATPDIPPQDEGPKPVAPEHVPEEIAISQWLVTYVNKVDQDFLWAMIEKGTFVPPTAPGKDALGVQWMASTPKEDGFVTYPGFGLTYAVSHFETTEPTGVIVRADRVYQVYVNGEPQPGDVYGSRHHRLPAFSHKGDNWVALVSWNLGGPLEAEIWTTPDELFLNPDDLTFPDLVEGDAEDAFLGVPTLNLTDSPALFVNAQVIEDETFKASEMAFPSMGPGALAKLPFRLTPKAAWPKAGTEVKVTLRVESPSLAWQYEKVVTLQTVTGASPFRKTFLSSMDGSAQYYGLLPPKDWDPGKTYSLALSLHGAGVDAIGQAGAYSQKDWVFIAAATNRRPFGFDWEEWGRLDGIEVLEHVISSYPIDPTHVNVTGHSMGGHGTWQFGVLFPGRFAVVGPSAGWSSFYSYGGDQKPTGPFARARASSDTLNYVGNLAKRAVYMIHGDKDDNVPISEANLMYAAVSKVAPDLKFHVEPGAGHWWDKPETPGADCVDWPELFDWMKERKLDPFETDFTWTSPSPWVNARHSFVKVESEADPYKDVAVTAKMDGSKLAVTTSNVRAMVLDGKAMKGKGVTDLAVDGATVALADGPIAIGPAGGKTAQVHGPFNQVFHRPFCLVYPDEGPPAFRRYAALLSSTWTVIGNGVACVMPLSKLTAEVKANRNIVYIGVPRTQIAALANHPFSWEGEGVTLGDKTFKDAALVFVFPDNGRLDAVMTATTGFEHLLFMHQPFSSRSGLPDYLVWGEGGGMAAGFFDSEWKYPGPAGGP